MTANPVPLYPVLFDLGSSTGRCACWLEEEHGGMYFLADETMIPMVRRDELASLLETRFAGWQLIDEREPMRVSVNDLVRSFINPDKSKSGPTLTGLDMVEDLFLTACALDGRLRHPESDYWRSVVVDARNAFFDDLSVADVVLRIGSSALVTATVGLWSAALTRCGFTPDEADAAAGQR